MLNVEWSRQAPHSTFNIKHSTFLVLLISLSPDPRPDGVQSLLDPLVSPIDLMNVVDDALPLRAERGEQQRHAGADVGAGDLRAVEAIAADDDGAVRIAQDDARPHGDELVGEEEARLEHLPEDHGRPLGL